MSDPTVSSPTASIIVTCYNIEPYIEQCLDSVTDQTLRDIEIIVVDDGSTDATPDIVTAYAERDQRIVPLLMPDNTPGGVATAANLGLDRATGGWVGFVDGDDFIEPTMFAKLVDTAERHDTELAICQYLELDEQSGELGDPADVKRWADLRPGRYDLDPATRRIFLPLIAVPWRKLYRRELLEREPIRFPVGDYFYEDNPFHWFALLSATSIAVVPEVLCFHRVARAGQTMATADERLFRIFRHHDTIAAWLAARGDLTQYGDALVSWVVSQLEWIAYRTPGALRQELFDIVAPILQQYDAATIDRALNFGKKGTAAQELARAVHRGNFASFTRSLNQRAGSNPLTAAAYHLRYSGVAETARLTNRYVRRKASGLAPAVRRNGRAVTNEDLMLAMMLLEQRIEELSDRIDAIASDRGPDQPTST